MHRANSLVGGAILALTLLAGCGGSDDGSAAANDSPAVTGAVIKDPVSDAVVWREYLETVVRERPGWLDFYRAARDA